MLLTQLVLCCRDACKTSIMATLCIGVGTSWIFGEVDIDCIGRTCWNIMFGGVVNGAEWIPVSSGAFPCL
jgi:hypothetical protein